MSDPAVRAMIHARAQHYNTTSVHVPPVCECGWRPGKGEVFVEHVAAMELEAARPIIADKAYWTGWSARHATCECESYGPAADNGEPDVAAMIDAERFRDRDTE